MLRVPPIPRFARFLMVGVIGFVIDAGVSNLLVAMAHASPLAARVPAFLLATVATYTANRSFTFGDQSTPFLRGWIRYVAATGVGAMLNYITYSLLVTSVFHGPWAVILAIGAGSVVGLGVNYFSSVRLVFAR